MKKVEKKYLENILQSLNKAIILVSKGQAWLEITKDNVRLTGENKEAIKNVGILQMMFGKTKEIKQFPMKEVQKALDYFGWKVYLVEEDKCITFRGEDKFLIVQIFALMSGIEGKRYAEMVRDAYKNGEKMFFI